VSLVEPCTTGGIVGFHLGTKGDEYRHLIIPASGARMPRTPETSREIVDESGSVRTLEHLHMNGPAVFHFSVYKVPEVIKQALVSFHLTVEDLDLVVLHQANRMMVDQIYKSVGVPEEKRFHFMETVGNTSGASSALTLAEAWRQGKVRPGTRTLLAAFGVGLSWGVTAIEWPADVGPAVPAPVEFED
jgi:3-oxoacyl-[acyl-carrier-protein] synthase-3